jgi:hypothetical protein
VLTMCWVSILVVDPGPNMLYCTMVPLLHRLYHTVMYSMLLYGMVLQLAPIVLLPIHLVAWLPNMLLWQQRLACCPFQALWCQSLPLQVHMMPV